MRIAVSETIDAPRERVFALLADVQRWPEILSSVVRVDMLSGGAAGPGAVFRETRIMFGREASEVMTIAEMRAPEQFLLTAYNHGTAYQANHVLEAAGDGTRLTLEFSGQPRTLTARLLAPAGLIFAGGVRKQLVKDFHDIKRAAESTDRARSL